LPTATFAYRIEEPEVGIAIAHLEGKLRGKPECWEFLDAARALVENKKDIILDMQQLEHLDSNGVGVLMSLYSSVSSAKRRMVLACMGPRVQKILDVLWFLRILDHATTLDEAVAKAKAGGSTERAVSD